MGIRFDDYLYYDKTSPSHLRWAVDVRTGRNLSAVRIHKGSEAGTLTRNGYKVVLSGKEYFAHRVVWEMFKGDMPEGMRIDHIDGDNTNNRPDNLRCVTHAVNMRNRKIPSNNTSGTVGVHLQTRRSKGKKYLYVVAVVYSPEGGRTEKMFSVTKLGLEEATRLAVECRAAMIEALNRDGAGYTDRHGT